MHQLLTDIRDVATVEHSIPLNNYVDGKKPQQIWHFLGVSDQMLSHG